VYLVVILMSVAVSTHSFLVLFYKHSSTVSSNNWLLRENIVGTVLW